MLLVSFLIQYTLFSVLAEDCTLDCAASAAISRLNCGNPGMATGARACTSLALSQLGESTRAMHAMERQTDLAMSLDDP